MTRPPIPIDWDVVDQLLMCGCPGTEIAAHYAMHPNTFYDRVSEKFKVSFTEYMTQKRSNGQALLRKAQFEKAIGATKKGDNTLLIWLGKQCLDQRDTPVTQTVSDEVSKQFAALMKQLGDAQAAAQDPPQTQQSCPVQEPMAQSKRKA